MRESEFTQRLLKALRAHPAMKDAVIFKHNDRSTRGIPDFSISIGMKTLWVEVKKHGNSPTKIQSYFISKLRDGCLIIVHRIDIVSIQQQGSFELYRPEEAVESIVRRMVTK